MHTDVINIFVSHALSRSAWLTESDFDAINDFAAYKDQKNPSSNGQIPNG